jgi:hypothetical protein
MLVSGSGTDGTVLISMFICNFRDLAFLHAVSNENQLRQSNDM